MKKNADDPLIRADSWQCGLDTFFVAWRHGRICYSSTSPDAFKVYLSEAYAADLSRERAVAPHDE